MMKSTAALRVALCLALHLGRSAYGFRPTLLSRNVPAQHSHRPTGTTSTGTQLNVVLNDDEHILDKTLRILQDFPPLDEQFDANLKTIFPSAIANSELESKVVSALADRGFRADNTLLATSLCSDETARQLEDDFVKIYGSNFNLGGLAGFPFAGNIGFTTMSGHVPDGGFCLLVYGPHVGITRAGEIGKVERKGVSQDDACCTSAIKACNCILGHATDVVADPFADLQQGAVQNLLSPLGDRLQASEYPMLELPYLVYESQQPLIEEIIRDGIGNVKEGIALLGGIQINTGPDTLDYFHPLCFQLVNNSGEVEDMLSELS